MTYSIIGILATVVLIINNRDVLWGREDYNKTPTYIAYRHLLYGILGYLITDMLWGILASHQLITLVYIDTVIHFMAMALAVMLWTRYVTIYLGNKQGFGKLLNFTGTSFVCFEAIVILINFFIPILFSFDSKGESLYPAPAPYVLQHSTPVNSFLRNTGDCICSLPYR